MSETIARGQIQIDVDDEKALRDLRRIDDEFTRAMEKIDRQDATVDIKGNLKDLEKDLKEAEAQVKEFEKEREKAAETSEKRQTAARLREARKREKIARDAVDREREALKIQEEKNREFDTTSKKLALIERREKALARVQEQSERRRIAAQRAEQRESDKLARQEEKGEKARLAAIDKEAKYHKSYSDMRVREITKEAKARKSILDQRDREMSAAERAAYQMEKERREVPRLEAAYVRLFDKLQQIQRVKHGAKTSEQLFRIEVDEREVVSQLDHLRNEIRRRVGRDPVAVPVEMTLARRAGARLRDTMLRRGTWTGVAGEIGADMGKVLSRRFHDVTERGIRNTGRDVGRSLAASIAGGVGRVGTRILHGVEGLGNVAVRLGPITASIKQAIVGMSILAPLVVDLVGALGSLVSVTASAALGLGALGAAVIGGAVPAAIGLFTALKPVVATFKHATQLSQAYQKALSEGNEDLAAKKLKALHSVLKGTDQQTQSAFINAGKLAGNWKKLTAPAQVSALNVIGAGFKFLNANLSDFARNTNQSADVLGKGLQGIIQGLDVHALDTMWKNFNAGLGPALSGMGNLLTYVMRVGAAASHFLRPMTTAFNNWSESILATTDNADRFQQKIDGVVNSAKNVGRFFMASGRLLKTFFAGGVSAGNSMTVTMTNALNRWNDFLRTTQGQKGLNSFFEQSVKGAQALFSVLAPITRTFVQWAEALAPIVRPFLQGAGAVSSFVGSLLEMTALRGPLTALAATLGAIWSVGKIAGATRAVAGFSSALLGVGRAQAAIGAAGAAGGAVGAVEGGLLGAGGAASVGRTAAAAEKAAGSMSRGAKAAGLLRGGLTAVGAAAGIANPVMGATILAAAGIATAFVILNKHANQWKHDMEDQRKNAEAAAGAYRLNTNSLGDLTSAHERANISVRQARDNLKHVKKGTDDYKLALLDLRDAQRYAKQTGDQMNKTRTEAARDAKQQIDAEQKRVDILDKQIQKEKDSAKSASAGRFTADQRSKALERLNDLENKRGALVAAVERAQNRQAASTINLTRGAQGLVPVLGAAEQKLGALARQSKSTAVKIALKFDAPQDVGRVAASASARLKQGVPARIVTKIVADSSNANEAIRRLQGVKLLPKKLVVGESGGSGVMSILGRITGQKLSPKQQKIAQAGGQAVIGMLASIIGIKIPNKSTTVTANTGGALGAISSVISALASIPAVKTITTVFKSIGSPGKKRARGRNANPGAERALVAEGNGPEIIANHKTGAMTVLREPTFVNLTPEDFVIPTEPRFRKRGKDLFQEFAKAAGIPGFRKGRHAPLSPKYVKKKGSDPAKLKWPVEYQRLQGVETDRNREISIAQSKVKEPSTFLKVIGKDKDGNEIYQVDEGAISTYSGQLGAVKSLTDSLINPGGVLDQLQHAATESYKQLDNYVKNRNANIHSFDETMKRNKRLFKSHDKDTREAAHKRYDRAADLRRGEVQRRTDAGGVRKDIADDQHDAFYRRQEYAVDSNDLLTDINAIRPDAIADRDRSNPQPQKPDTTPTTPDTPDVPSKTEQTFTLSDARAALYKDMGSNFKPIAQAAGAGVAAGIANVFSPAAGVGINPVVHAGLSTLRASSAASSVLTSSGASRGVTGGGSLSGTSVVSSPQSGPTQVAGGNGNNVSIENINFPVAPTDPHTFSRGLMWELSAVS